MAGLFIKYQPLENVFYFFHGHYHFKKLTLTNDNQRHKNSSNGLWQPMPQ